MKSKIGQKLAALRKARGITQAEAGAEIGIARSTLASIESGKDNPGRETLIAMADFYKVSLDYLASGNDGSISQSGDYSPENDESFLLIRESWIWMSPEQRRGMALAADALTAPVRIANQTAPATRDKSN